VTGSLRRRAPALLAAVALTGLGLTAAAVPAQAAPAAAAKVKACSAGYVGLTFDDGPSATTPQLLTALRTAGLRATMFNQGNNALARPDQVWAERGAKMWIGNHSYTHPHLTQLDQPTRFQEITSTQWVLTDLLGKAPTLFRPPFGETDAAVRADEDRAGLLEVLWTVDSEDWNGNTVEGIVARAATLQPGGIILMHDWPANTIAAIPQIAAGLKARGLCAGKIAYTPRDVPFGSTTFHAEAVRP
jgi:peptidoglycan/xylan/chitin deacetylase (PgdA/CDA1 family)